MNEPFKLSIELLTPFHMGHRITLDGLLSAAIHNATGLIGDEIAAIIPLESESGIFKGSSLFVGGDYRHQVVGRIMALKGASDMDVNAFSPNGRGGRYFFIDPQRDAYKYNMSQYQGIQAECVEFFGFGDAEQCRELIQNFTYGIGKRATAGAGQIGEITISYLDQDESFIRSDGTPARPLPIAMWNMLGGEDAPRAKIPVRFPYWDSNSVEAVFPTSLT
jgi:hypothetical protein